MRTLIKNLILKLGYIKTEDAKQCIAEAYNQGLENGYKGGYFEGRTNTLKEYVGTHKNFTEVQRIIDRAAAATRHVTNRIIH